MIDEQIQQLISASLTLRDELERDEVQESTLEKWMRILARIEERAKQ